MVLFSVLRYSDWFSGFLSGSIHSLAGSCYFLIGLDSFSVVSIVFSLFERFLNQFGWFIA